MVCKIDPAKCISCHTCQGVCPMSAISIGQDGKCMIDPNKCVSCQTCVSLCPMGAIQSV